MSDFSTSNQSESIDTETGEIRYRKTLAKPVAAQRTSRGKIPSIHVENHITIPASVERLYQTWCSRRTKEKR